VNRIIKYIGIIFSRKVTRRLHTKDHRQSLQKVSAIKH